MYLSIRCPTTIYYCRECPVHNMKLTPLEMLQFRSFGKCEVTLHCHYSQVHSELEEEYLFRFHILFKYISLKIIDIRYVGIDRLIKSKNKTSDEIQR